MYFEDCRVQNSFAMSARPPSSSPEPQLAELVVSAERHEFMHELIEYVQGIHHHIDPEMYEIQPERLEHFAWCFEGDQIEPSGFVMTVTYKDLLELQLIVDAAYTYSNRKTSGSRAASLTNVGFEAIVEWLSQAQRALFYSGPTR
jgi:hypothetical protein